MLPPSEFRQRSINEEVKSYQPLVEKIARMHRHLKGVEYDDLVQEGMIAVWLAVRAGHPVQRMEIRWRMLNWGRFVQRLARLQGGVFDDALEVAA